MADAVYYRTDETGTMRALRVGDLRGVLERLDPALPLESGMDPVLSVQARSDRVYVTNSFYQRHMDGSGGSPMTVGDMLAALRGLEVEDLTLSFLGSLLAVRTRDADGDSKAYVELDHEGYVMLAEPGRVDLSAETGLPRAA